MRKLAIVTLIIVFLFGMSVDGFELVHFVSKPSRVHVNVDASLVLGRLKYPAWGNEEIPHLSRMPRVKVGLVPVVIGTEIWGTNISRLLTNEGFTEFIARNYPNLKTIEFGEQYEQFRGGEMVTTSKLYNALTNTGVEKEKAGELASRAFVEGVNWTIPATEDNFESVSIFPGFENRSSLGEYFTDELKRKNGEALGSISQGYFPSEGFATEPLSFTICHPYTTIPVVYAEDQYMDYFFRPIGTIIEKQGGTIISKPGSESACAVRFKYEDTVVENIPIKHGRDSVDDVTINLNVRYSGEYRFDFAIDPPQIGGQANLPLVSTDYGSASMYDIDNNQHFVQSFPSLRRFYKWMPHSDPGYTTQRLLITPAVRTKCFHESRLWELSHFTVFYPVSKLEDGHVIMSEESVDVMPESFEEISMGEIAYFKFTNLPWLEDKENTHYIYAVDRPMRIVAVYEPGDFTPRGKGVVAESTRLTLNWAVTNEMKKLAELKRKEWGENWWSKSFPTYYTITIKGEGFEKKIKKINPLQGILIVEGLEPGTEYTWELATWVSDDNGSSTLMDTWVSEIVKTIPLPELIGHCAKADAIKLETEIDDEGDEVWKIITPFKYRLGSAELQPMNFEASPGARMTPIHLNLLDMVEVTSEVSPKHVLIARIKITEFADNFEKNEKDQNIIHVFFRPIRVKVKGIAVDELYQPIGAGVGGQIGQWWPAADSLLVESPIKLVSAPLMYKGKNMYRFKEWRWNGKIHATKSPFKDLINGTNIIMIKAFGCQDDPEKPVELVMYAVYEVVEVDCFAVSVDFTVNWNIVDQKYKIPISPGVGDCPGNNKQYMAGTKVSIGPVPDKIKVDELEYKFVGWIVGNQTYTGISRLTVIMDSDKRILANYQPSDSRYKLTFYAILGSKRIKLNTKIFPGTDRDGLFIAGETVQIGPVPLNLNKGEYVFSGWSVDGVLQPPSENFNSFQLVMDGHHRVAAVYELALKRRD